MAPFESRGLGNRRHTEGVDGLTRQTRPQIRPTSRGARMSLDLASMEEGVVEAIEAIRPALQSDGGDIVFQHIDEDGVVHVALVGACGSCPVSTMTLKAGV